MNPKPLDLEAIAIFAPDEEPIGSRILYVNDAFVRMSGYLAEQLVGHSALLLAGARPDPEAMRRAVSAPLDRPYVARERRRRPDGSTYEALVRLEPLPMAMSSSTTRPARMVLTMRMLESSHEAEPNRRGAPTIGTLRQRRSAKRVKAPRTRGKRRRARRSEMSESRARLERERFGPVGLERVGHAIDVAVGGADDDAGLAVLGAGSDG